MDNNERWTPVPNYEGYYEVSSEGRVKSLPRIVNRKNDSVQPWPGKILKPQLDKTGYQSVTLCKDGFETRKMVHRIVAESFLERVDGSPYVLHGNGNKRDNRLQNLRWGTNSENVQDTIKHGTRRSFWAERTHCSSNHEYTEENTRWYKGHRYCKTCGKAAQKRYREKKGLG